jgi:hypothetical protein
MKCDKCMFQGWCDQTGKCFYDCMDEKKANKAINKMTLVELNQLMEDCLKKELYEICNLIKKEFEKRWNSPK